MLRAITWCAKCLFLYLLVAIAAVRYSWVFTAPVWQIANKMHWTQLSRLVFVLSYFLPIFAVAGFLLGLVPFGKLGKAIGELFASLFPSASSQLAVESDLVAPALWAWLPVTLAFLIRFATWQSQNSSIFDPHRTQGRVERFFGPLHSQAPSLLDSRWISDRFLFTGPMLFLMACAIATLLRHRLSGSPRTKMDAIEQ
jgi:hypothetical protein